MQRINILHIIESLFPYGGTPRKLLTIARNVDREKYRIFVAVFQREVELEEKFREAGAEVVLLRARKKWDVLTVMDILSAIRTYRINLVNTHFSRANVYGRIAAIVSRVPVIVNEHGIPRSHKLTVKIMDNLLSLFTEKFICNSHAVLREVKRDIFIRRANFAVVQNGIDANVFFETNSNNRNGLRRQLGINPDDIVIANVSGLIPIRDHRTLIHAFADIHKKLHTVKLLLVGDGPLRGELTELSERLGVERSISFTGYRSDVPSLLRLAHIYVDPTLLAGGFQFNVMEALLSGLPVIAVSAGVPPDDIIRHNVDGMLVPPGNPASMAKALEKLIKDGSEQKRLGQAGRRKVLEKYSAEMFVRNICRVYDEVIH